MDSEKFKKAVEAMDRFNGQDPRREMVNGVSYPLELIYSQRLVRWVMKLNPQASEALRLAARGQHIGRWTLPREKYPMDRGGYLRWREALKIFHAQKTGEILEEAGYGAEVVQRVRTLISKKNLKRDADTQTLEDALCLVFLETQFEDLKRKTPDDKMKDIVRKTWRKMSPQGQAAALALELPADAKKFLASALS